MITLQRQAIRASETQGSPLASIPPADPTPKGRISVLLPAMAFFAANWGDHSAVIEQGREALAAVGARPDDADFDDPTIS